MELPWWIYTNYYKSVRRGKREVYVVRLKELHKHMLRKQYVRSCRQTEESLQEPERGSSCFDLPYAAQESQLHVIRYRFDGIDQFWWSKLLQPEESIFERPSRTKKFARFKKPSRFFTRWWSSLIFLSWNLYEHSSRRTKSPTHEAISYFTFLVVHPHPPLLHTVDS